MTNHEELAAYRRGIESGTMKSATRNVVRDLLDHIEEQAKEIERLKAENAEHLSTLEGLLDSNAMLINRVNKDTEFIKNLKRSYE